ncbi:cyclophane-forming radical SAM/SPASM peptide maturase YhhB [Blastomonas aquatica]|uniref:Radical SAM protein n=1 Tax=Blastomonas aquatica TaxID=1510276 RepID=A0ABQ1JR95_9SPHN|nr:cyclophane-forming radical SAM/SPASM peptide maturase YhhB [Blastomonas aquatica]GGB72715.1 radical SAM protein [Blastomonas aquatica]
MSGATITSFLVKVASRCNLDCDYCYVYHHADQGWRKLPRYLSVAHQDAFADRLADYAREAGLSRIAVIFHGGEPLLMGHAQIVDLAVRLRSAVGEVAQLDIGLQTNGLLLTDDALDAFEAENIGVSLSMDGPREAQDLHRTSRKGRSSFNRALAALERLKQRPKIFAGVIAVIDPAVCPSTLLDFFDRHAVPKIDFLLPDAHHGTLPPGRATDPGLYERWLIRAFDMWLDHYPQLAVRTFEALLDGAAGLSSGTDAFGFGDVSLITLETDGTWHDLDVLKVAGEGASRLMGTVDDTAIAVVASSPRLALHRHLLTMDGLSPICRECDVVKICGGGAVPHRFRDGGFSNPTVYCTEMRAIIRHVVRRLNESLVESMRGSDEPASFDIAAFEFAELSSAIMNELAKTAFDADLDGLRHAMTDAGYRPDSFEDDVLENVARRAGTIGWQRARSLIGSGRQVRDVDGNPIDVDDTYLGWVLGRASDCERLELGAADEWLRKPFGTSIVFEPEELSANGRDLVVQALAIIDEWRPSIGAELRSICSAVQFIRDPSAHPDKIVSFSDDSVPGALFVSIYRSDGLIDAYDLADSLVHEYRHQKLYLLERLYPTSRPGALVASPWREDLRPVSGLIHAAFVFVELRRFWRHIRDAGPERLHNRAIAQLEDTERNLGEAFETLRSCDLTRVGRSLVDILESSGRQLPLVA